MKVLILSFFLILNTRASNIIYNEERDSDWLPLTYLINGTFDVIQNPYWFSQRHYNQKSEEVWRRIKDPHKNIKRDGGYSKLFKDEFLSGRVLPNIGLHFLGGAYDTLWLMEYFRAKGFPYPRLGAFLVTYMAHFGNEALETTSDKISSHDHIADLYFFDVAAFIMAQYPQAMSYLTQEMGMKAWHFNPMYDIDGENFFNVGLNYIFRPKAVELFNHQIRPLLYLGMQTLGGATYQYEEEKALSLAMGISLTDPLTQKGRFVTGLFYEENEELEASLFLNGSEDYRWRLNLYQGLLGKVSFVPKHWQVSLMLGQGKGPTYAAGINVNLPLGIGFIKNSPFTSHPQF